MAQYRVQIANHDPDGPFRDAVVNTFYLDSDLAAIGGADAEALLDDALDLWAAAPIAPLGQLQGKIYNMADAEPRQPIATRTQNTGKATTGPREVAVCLSYRAGANTPRRRGRMFMGPFTAGSMGERVSSTIRGGLATLAEGISGLGGPNVQWVQHSPTTGNYTNVSAYWIDNEWDTVRSRGRSADERTNGTVNG